MTQTMTKQPEMFEPGDEVFTEQANRLYHGVVEALGPERYEVQVRADSGELLTVHKFNVKHVEHELTLRDYAAIAEELGKVPGSAHAQEMLWRETTDLDRFSELEHKIIHSSETPEEKAEYDKLLEGHPGQAALTAEIIPAIRAARAARLQPSR